MAHGFELEPEARLVIEQSAEIARVRKHEFICVEHLLKAILDSKSGAEIIAECCPSPAQLASKLEDFFTYRLTQHTVPLSYEPIQTIGYQRVVQSAVIHAQYSSAEKLTVGDLLVSIYQENESHAVFFLLELGITKLAVLEAISRPIDGEDFKPDFEQHRQ